MNRQPLQAVRFDGLHTDSLGHYLAALGLFLAASRKWPELRACWRNGRFLLLGESLTYEQIETYLLDEWKPTLYERWWTDAQKADTKAQNSRHLRRERNGRSVAEMRLLDAHIISAERNRFNRVLGTGGNIGKRDLGSAFAEAKALLATPDRGARLHEENRRAWLRETLKGEGTADLPDLNSAGTWFVFASKTFNSGQNWYREAKLSPWSYLLSLEGAMLISGSASRKLGAHARSYAAFPFLTEPPAPATDKEVGLSKAEFWAPLWDCPANVNEIRALFQRGLARLGDRAAQAPHEFAVAALAAGVDGGVRAFAPYDLRQTTNSQVYEAIPLTHVPVSQPEAFGPKSRSELLLDILGPKWLDRLPREPTDPKQRGVTFSGYRAPIEKIIRQISQARDNDREPWRQLLLEMADAQRKIDLNNKLRGEGPQPVPWLKPDFFDQAWPGSGDDLTPEIRLARAIASVGASKDKKAPIQFNIFGVEAMGQFLRFVAAGRPAWAVWNTGDPLRMLGKVFQRRLIDAKLGEPLPLGGTQPVPAELLNRFLDMDSDIDLEEVAKWVPALSLIDWSGAEKSGRISKNEEVAPTSGDSWLDALFRPFFHGGELHLEDRVLIAEDDLKRLGCRAAFARRLFNLISQGEIAEACQVAKNRYLALNRLAIIMPPGDIEADDPARLVAALLIPMHADDAARRLKLWLQPQKTSR
jgi:CRISPR-associated protein Csx17